MPACPLPHILGKEFAELLEEKRGKRAELIEKRNEAKSFKHPEDQQRALTRLLLEEHHAPKGADPACHGSPDFHFPPLPAAGGSRKSRKSKKSKSKKSRKSKN
jgi:hypothetical protein